MDLTLTDLVVVGAGGHGREILETVRAACAAAGMAPTVHAVDDEPGRSDLVERAGVPFLGPLAELERMADGAACQYLLGVGAEQARATLDHRFSELGLHAAVVAHPAASIGAGNDLSPGVVLFAGARLTTNVRLGRHTHLNVNSSVSHDSVVGDHTTISPGAVVAGACVIGDRVLVGAGATVLQGRRIGDDARVGAGAVVVDDVPPGVTVVGVPARPLPRS